jgi:hypothetical protein
MNPQDWLISSLEVGNIISAFFLGVLTLQVYNYYITFPKDRPFLKCFVSNGFAPSNTSVADSTYPLGGLSMVLL